MSASRTISQILREDHSIILAPGTKGMCPKCGAEHFSVTADDTLGKCFAPTCGYYLTRRDETHPKARLSRVLEAVAADCHAELLRLKDVTHYQTVYHYLLDRGVHPTVIQEARLGAVPSGYNLNHHTAPVLLEAQAALEALASHKAGRPTKQAEQALGALETLTEQCAKLAACFRKHAGWLVFVYTDHAHRPCALRLRKPFEKAFVSFKPHQAGLFGRELYTPHRDPAFATVNDILTMVEGEFNLLRLQSLTLRYTEATGTPLGYLNACAVGSVTSVDTDTLARVTQHPVICYDHDQSQAGFELVKRLQAVMPVEAFTVPDVESDLDDYLGNFSSPIDAWEGLQELVQGRESYGRIYSGTGKEFLAPPVNGGKERLVPKLLAEALMDRDTYAYEASRLWCYRDGVYRPMGEAVARADIQTLLGNETTIRATEEALAYLTVATRRHLDEEEIPRPDSRYINCTNGRLEWSTGAVEPHAPTFFTTIQIPVAYDAEALCPTFDTYLETTLPVDTHPLVEEILGWCLVPDGQKLERSVMLTGEGKNGKGVFLDLVQYLLGDRNVANVPLQELEESRFMVAELYGKLANVFADLDARALRSSSLFKMLTSGDRLKGERKHQHPFYFRSYAKLLFSANKIPPSHDTSYAFYRRWLIIPFDRTFDGEGPNPKPDLGLRDKLTHELPGILNRALTGLKRLITVQDFTQPASVKEALRAYVQKNDALLVFLADCVSVDTASSISQAALSGYLSPLVSGQRHDPRVRCRDC